MRLNARVFNILFILHTIGIEVTARNCNFEFIRIPDLSEHKDYTASYADLWTQDKNGAKGPLLEFHGQPFTSIIAKNTSN